MKSIHITQENDPFLCAMKLYAELELGDREAFVAGINQAHEDAKPKPMTKYAMRIQREYELQTERIRRNFTKGK